MTVVLSLDMFTVMADTTQAYVKKVILTLTQPEGGTRSHHVTSTEPRTTTNTEPGAAEFTESLINNNTAVLCQHSHASIAPDS